MLKVGDKLIAKEKFMIKHGSLFGNRNYIIKEIWSFGANKYGFQGVVESEDGNKLSGFIDINLFYVAENLNHLIECLLEKEEIKSFSAVTVDGKIINMELT